MNAIRSTTLGLRVTKRALAARFRKLGVEKVEMKRLSDRQDNSQNQIYWQGSLNENPLPIGGFVAFKSTSSRARGETGYRATCLRMAHPNQYQSGSSGAVDPLPAVSRDATGQPAGREPSTHRAHSWVPERRRSRPPASTRGLRREDLRCGSASSRPCHACLGSPFRDGPFRYVGHHKADQTDKRRAAAAELAGVHRLSPAVGCTIAGSKVVKRANPNTPGTTLETLMGVKPNSKDEPDFHGWELKSHGDACINLCRLPQPTGGAVVSEAPEDFMRKFGWITALARGGTTTAPIEPEAPGGKATTMLDLTADEVRLVHQTTG